MKPLNYVLSATAVQRMLGLVALALGLLQPLIAQDRGNTTAQEYGDAVYRSYEPFSFPGLSYDYNHTGIFAGLDSSHNGRVLQAYGPGTTTEEVSLSSVFTSYGTNYYGAYTLSNQTMSFSDRKNVVKTASDLANALIPYPPTNPTLTDIFGIPYAILYYGTSFDGSVGDISNIRCDGFVEYSYEKNNYRVWRNTDYPDSQWSIVNYPDTHNDLPDNTRNPNTELSPWAQRGAPPTTGPYVLGSPYSGPPYPDTKMTSSAIISYPTYQVTQTAGNGYVDVVVTATDESGIHLIGYKKPGDSNWSYSPTQAQHPTSASYSYSVRATSSGTFAVFAEDNGGNIPTAALGYTVTMASAPVVIATQPQSQAVSAGTNLMLTMAAASSSATIQWQRNGIDVVGATNSTLAINNVQPGSSGLYTAIAMDGNALLTSDPAIVGVLTTDAVLGAGSVVGTNILHPNGNHFDQVLVTGPAESITADYADNRITRTSYIDLSDNIVQVEFSGAGTLSLVLDGATGPAQPLNYNQAVNYMKGHAGIVITGANESTNVSVFTVGRATAVDPTGGYNILLPIGPANNPANNGSPLFQGHATTNYDGVADIAFIAILSTDGKFGGVRTSNTRYSASKGLTGVYAPGVTFQGPLYIGNIDGFGAATASIQVGSVADARITGGDLAQDNGAEVQVSGLTQLKFTDGTDSEGNALPAKANRAVLEQSGTDVTAQIVVNPTP